MPAACLDSTASEGVILAGCSRRGVRFLFCQMEFLSLAEFEGCEEAFDSAVAMTPGIDFDLSRGERFVRISYACGNAALEEVVMATKVRGDQLPYDTGIRTSELFRSSQLLTTLTHEPVQANKAIVGRNAFAHEAGIHQDGVIKDRRTYEIMRPEDVGVKSTLVLGKHSGRHAVKQRCQQLGHELTRFELDRVYRAIIALADQKKQIEDGDVDAIVTQVCTEQAPASPAQAERTA